MFHHISLAAVNPARVAQVLAEITGGQAFDFPVCPGAFMVVVGDQYGSGIEVLPQDTAWIPGETEAEARPVEGARRFSPLHAALSVSANRDTLEAIGRREGWLVRLCDRGPFQLLELWIENSFMLELIPQDMVAPYLEFMVPERYADFLTDMAALA